MSDTNEIRSPEQLANDRLDELKDARRNERKADAIDVVWIFAGLCFVAWLILLMT